MIPLTRLDGSSFYLNHALIASIEEAHDTVVALTTGDTLMVGETALEIIELMIDYQRRLVTRGFDQV